MRSKSPKSLLIIEDSVSITYRLVRMLKEISNLNIIGAVRNGTSGYKKIIADSPDIVLLDLQVPGTNGVKILEKLTTQKEKPYVIILTNNSNFYFKEKCLTLGASKFFDKTVQFEEAIQLVNKLCNEEG